MKLGRMVRSVATAVNEKRKGKGLLPRAVCISEFRVNEIFECLYYTSNLEKSSVQRALHNTWTCIHPMYIFSLLRFGLNAILVF